jgi:kinesin family protein 13
LPESAPAPPSPALTLAPDCQTGSGKSYSMVGNPDDHGIVPRVASELFDYINSKKDDNIAFEVVTSMIEIYKEQIRDLLTQKQGRPGSTEELKVRHPSTLRH